MVVLSRDNTNHQPLKYYYQLLLYVNSKKAATLKPVGLVCPRLRCFARLSRLCPLWGHWMQQLGVKTDDIRETDDDHKELVNENLKVDDPEESIARTITQSPNAPAWAFDYFCTICKYKQCKLLCIDVDCFYINIYQPWYLSDIIWPTFLTIKSINKERFGSGEEWVVG